MRWKHEGCAANEAGSPSASGARCRRIGPAPALVILDLGLPDRERTWSFIHDFRGLDAGCPSWCCPPVRPKQEKVAALTLAALGVVYGDIGTSPLYA
jgi:hypothetical protein